MRRPWTHAALLCGLAMMVPWTAPPQASEQPSQIVLDGQGRYRDMELRSGDVHLHLFYEEGEADTDFPRSPTLHVFVGGAKVQVIEDGGNGFEWPRALDQIVEMDPTNPHPEVLFSTYSGGAHCCNIRRIVASAQDGKSWHLIEGGAIDGDISGARDADFDGTFEIVHRDNRFLYTFASYAGSTAPLQIFALKGRELVDVSFEERFRYLHEQTLRDMETDAGNVAGMHERNGFLAGYVAVKYLLGQGREGWQFMLDNYDRNSDWDLSACIGGYDEDGNCRKTTRYPEFPAALKDFLKRAGYIR